VWEIEQQIEKWQKNRPKWGSKNRPRGPPGRGVLRFSAQAYRNPVHLRFFRKICRLRGWCNITPGSALKWGSGYCMLVYRLDLWATNSHSPFTQFNSLPPHHYLLLLLFSYLLIYFTTISYHHFNHWWFTIDTILHSYSTNNYPMSLTVFVWLWLMVLE